MSASRKLQRKHQGEPPAQRAPIQDAWESFERYVLPGNASDVQRAEMRKAFFSGASAIFQALVEVSGNEERGMKLMSDVQAEVDVFGQELDRAVLGERGQA